MDSSLDTVFQAIAAKARLLLLEKLREHDGLTLGEMADGLGMSRFGVMKHLAVLENAGLVRTERAGRLKLHYLEGKALESQAQWLWALLGAHAAKEKSA